MPQKKKKYGPEFPIKLKIRRIASIPRRKILRLIPYGIAAALAFFLLYKNLTSQYDTMIQTPFARGGICSIARWITRNAQCRESNRIQQGTIGKMNEKLYWRERHFFEVEKGSKFSVETDLGVVEVLGTSFNVYAPKPEIERAL